MVTDLALVVAYTNDATQHGSPKFLEPLFLSMDPGQATIEREKVKQQFLTMNQENDKRKYEAYSTLLTFVDFFQSVMINRGANRTFYPLKSNVTFPKGSPWNGASSYALNGKGDSGAIRLFAMDHNGTIILVEDRHMMYHEKGYYTTLPYSFQGKEYVIPMSSYPEKINFPEGNGVSISYETIESYLSRNKHKLNPKEIEKFYEKYGEKGKKSLPKGHNPSVLIPSANQLDQTKDPTTSLQDPLRACDRDLHAISLRATLNKTKNYNLRIKGSHIQVTIPGHGTRTMPRSSTGKKRKAYEQIIVDWLVEVSQQ